MAEAVGSNPAQSRFESEGVYSSLWLPHHSIGLPGLAGLAHILQVAMLVLGEEALADPGEAEAAPHEPVGADGPPMSTEAAGPDRGFIHGARGRSRTAVRWF